MDLYDILDTLLTPEERSELRRVYAESRNGKIPFDSLPSYMQESIERKFRQAKKESERRRAK